MSLNLIEAAKSLFTNEIVSKAGSYLGESESGVSKAISGLVPSIFGRLIQKSSTPEGASSIADLASKQSDSPSLFDNLGSFFGGGQSSSSGLLSSLFGNNSGGIVDKISSFAGIKSSSASSLFGLAVPTIMGFLGKHFASNSLGSTGIADLLSSQKQNVSDSLPSGFSLSSIFSGAASAVSNVAGNVTDAAGSAVSGVANLAGSAVAGVAGVAGGAVSGVANAAKATTAFVGEKASSGLKWLLPLLILVLLGAAALYFFKGGCKKAANAVTSVVDSTASAVSDVASGVASAVVGAIDSTGEFIYDLGKNTTIELPNGVGKLEVGENSTEAKLVKFLLSSDAVDTAKGNWFDFTNVKFNTGKSTITEASMTQLKDMVLISKAFPNAKFKIGGYTDNTGNEAANVTLSKSRAAVVAAKLKELGSTNIVSSDGYGSQFAIGDNATDAGRAQNRRVSVNVKAK